MRKSGNRDFKKSYFSFYIPKDNQLKYKIKSEFIPLSTTNKNRDLISFNILTEILNQEKKKKKMKLILVSQILQMDFLDSIFIHIFNIYFEKYNLYPFDRTIQSLKNQLGDEKVISLEENLEEYFNIPPYEGNHASILFLRDWIILFLKRKNPAINDLKEIFFSPNLTNDSLYEESFLLLKDSFKNQPSLLPKEGDLISMLFKPIELFPHNLKDQIKYILENWKDFLTEELLNYCEQIVKKEEEEDTYFLYHNYSEFPKNTTPQDYSPISPSFEREKSGFSTDKNWMPSVVMIAKSTLVWLDQLSKKYKEPICRLQDIPEEELNNLSMQGFNALWLIGIWERSPASQKIKRIMGNSEAESSAYSLKSNTISPAIGGWEGLRILKEKANRQGIKIASDMVPNHTGIDSEWVEKHPDYFIQLDHPPFPNYCFTQENLSPHPNLEIRIEDNYYTKRDAAVVFEVKNIKKEKTLYLYHGNDGTSMPWNDTAQINFLNPKAKEAVIQEIIKIAKEFPIIRFDAAMTLAKKHVQRLWHPLLQENNTIPSRKKYGLPQEEFENLMPQEFWREVVDRVEKETPDTLLLAEAFWMLEGYFVRNLGLHRVYNSAFMNMLKEERNKEYRHLIKEIIRKDSQILKRFVNFMSNPDEDTAISQFGKGDKYFGVCTLMATLPGLPMFGHGQIEGFYEKYGMEYSKSYWNESADRELVKKHEKEIFPLLHRRKLFCEIDNFELYDFFSNENINENVFAYSNGDKNSLNLVVYNNSYSSTRGFINIKNNFQKEEDIFVFIQEFPSFRWYMKKSKDVSKHIHFSLEGYGKKILINIQEKRDSSEKELLKLYEKVKESGFEGDLEQVINSFKKNSQSILYWEKLYKNDYLKNWAAFNFSNDSLKTLFKDYLYNFIELSNKSTLFNENFKTKLEEELNIFWDKVQFINLHINQIGENILLENWLSPLGEVFVYEKFYKFIYPLLQEINLVGEHGELLEEIKNKQLYSLYTNYKSILNLMSLLHNFYEKEPLNKKPSLESILIEKDSFINENRVYITNYQNFDDLLKVLTSWTIIWQFYPERNNKKKKIDLKVKKILETKNSSLTKENHKSTL